jgi:hypothetical protein
MLINLPQVSPVVGLLVSVWTVQATFSAAKRKSIVGGLVQLGRAARLGEVARKPTAESRGVFESARRKPVSQSSERYGAHRAIVARRKVRTAALGGSANATNDLNRRQRPSRLYAPHLIAIVAKLVSIAVANRANWRSKWKGTSWPTPNSPRHK